MAPSKTDEPKLKLPAGHPQAGYISPDLSFTDGVGTLPDEEQEILDERNAAQQAEAEAVAAHEDAVAKEEAAAALEVTPQETAKEAAPTRSSGGSSQKTS